MFPAPALPYTTAKRPETSLPAQGAGAVRCPNAVEARSAAAAATISAANEIFMLRPTSLVCAGATQLWTFGRRGELIVSHLGAGQTGETTWAPAAPPSDA